MRENARYVSFGALCPGGVLRFERAIEGLVPSIHLADRLVYRMLRAAAWRQSVQCGHRPLLGRLLTD
jgi:hypothetical protein